MHSWSALSTGVSARVGSTTTGSYVTRANTSRRSPSSSGTPPSPPAAAKSAAKPPRYCFSAALALRLALYRPIFIALARAASSCSGVSSFGSIPIRLRARAQGKPTCHCQRRREERREEKRRGEERRGREAAPPLSHFLRFLPDAALEEPAAPAMMAAASDMVELLWPRFASLLRGGGGESPNVSRREYNSRPHVTVTADTITTTLR